MCVCVCVHVCLPLIVGLSVGTSSCLSVVCRVTLTATSQLAIGLQGTSLLSIGGSSSEGYSEEGERRDGRIKLANTISNRNHHQQPNDTYPPFPTHKYSKPCPPTSTDFPSPLVIGALSSDSSGVTTATSCRHYHGNLHFISDGGTRAALVKLFAVTFEVLPIKTQWNLSSVCIGGAQAAVHPPSCSLVSLVPPQRLHTTSRAELHSNHLLKVFTFSNVTGSTQVALSAAYY